MQHQHDAENLRFVELTRFADQIDSAVMKHRTAMWLITTVDGHVKLTPPDKVQLADLNTEWHFIHNVSCRYEPQTGGYLARQYVLPGDEWKYRHFQSYDALMKSITPPSHA